MLRSIVIVYVPVNDAVSEIIALVEMRVGGLGSLARPPVVVVGAARVLLLDILGTVVCYGRCVKDTTARNSTD